MNQPENITPELLKLEQAAEIVVGEQQVDAAIVQLAQALNQYFSQPQFQQRPIVAYCVMNGGLYFAGQLLRHLTFPLQLSYLHATRYGNNTRGAALNWQTKPAKETAAQNHILLLDDIFDEGITLEAIADECRTLQAASVHSAVLIDKQHQRKPKSGFQPDFIGLEVSDRYIFGCGMDYQGLWRNLPAIYALKNH